MTENNSFDAELNTKWYSSVKQHFNKSLLTLNKKKKICAVAATTTTQYS